MGTHNQSKHSVSTGGDIGVFLIKAYALITLGVLISIGTTVWTYYGSIENILMIAR